MTYTTAIERASKARSGVALGGLGTGGIELRPDGIFTNWNIFNNQPVNTGPRFPFPEDSMLFFVVRYQEPGKPARMKLLQIDSGYEVAAIPNHYYIFPWLTGVDRAEYRARFPFVWMKFSDQEMPFVVELEAFSPFIPQDVKNSSLPAVIFNFKITPLTDQPVEVMLMASLRNAAGYDVEDKVYTSMIQVEEEGLVCQMGCEGLEPTAPTTGTLSLASLGGDSTYYLGWEHVHPYYEIALRSTHLPNLDDTEGRNPVDRTTGRRKAMSRLLSTLASSAVLQPGEAFEHSFVMSWNFPNRYSQGHEDAPAKNIGQYYASFFADAASAARYVASCREDLTCRTRRFVDALYSTTLDEFVLDQISAQMNTFVTSAWLARDGKFGILEGLTPAHSWGPLATIDVSFYGGVMLQALFPELYTQMIVSHRDMQGASGQISHGFVLNFAHLDVDDSPGSRLDKPAEYVVLALRQYFWSGDREYLKGVWESVKRALEYVLRERDPNGDGLPDMAGIMCSYDNFPMYGVSSYVGSMWLSALQHAVAAAQDLGDGAATARYQQVFERGLEEFEARLWNGSYYRLYNDMGGPNGTLDDACLTDQIIGQWASRLTGLGGFLAPERVKAALQSVMKMSYEPGFGLCNCRWPEDGCLHEIAPDIWVDQANTCWTGVELAFAAFLIEEGLVGEGLAVIRTVDERHRKSGMFFDHMEFGGHYFRPMAAWAVLNAALGLTIAGKTLRFEPKLAQDRIEVFFATPSATAFYGQDRTTGECWLRVVSGVLRLEEIECPLLKETHEVSVDGKGLQSSAYRVCQEGGRLRVRFAPLLTLTEGQRLGL